MKTILITIILFAAFSSQAQWTEQISGTSATLYAVSAVDNNAVWVCGAGGVVLLTTNGGLNWNVTSSPNTTQAIYTIWGISKTSALLAGSGSSSYLYKTTNSGNNWTLVFTENGGFINGIAGSHTDSNYLFMCGDPVGGRWSLWRSFNGGMTWDSSANNLRIPQNGSEAGFVNSLFMNYGYTWFGTIDERMYRIDSLGYTFQPTTGLAHMYGIWFNNAASGMTGASSMMITSNSGTNWTALSVPGAGFISAVTGIGNQWWFTRGNSVYYSSNNGATWSPSTTQSGFYYHMTKARASGNNNIWAVRQNGGISKLNYVTGIQQINVSIPDKFLLSQNYPNPFNPITKIKFDIPSSGHHCSVQLKVFDILGKQLAELINQPMKAGSYEVEFDGRNLASGIYFYRINAGDYVETKRMILVK